MILSFYIPSVILISFEGIFGVTLVLNENDITLIVTVFQLSVKEKIVDDLLLVVIILSPKEMFLKF